MRARARDVLDDAGLVDGRLGAIADWIVDAKELSCERCTMPTMDSMDTENRHVTSVSAVPRGDIVRASKARLDVAARRSRPGRPRASARAR